MVALDPKTGDLNWSDANAGPINTPAIANGVIYFTTGPIPGAPRALVAVRAADGGELKRAEDLNPQLFPPGPPSCADGMVFVGNLNGGIAVFALPT